MKYLEQTNSQRHKVDQRLPGSQWRGEWTVFAYEYTVSLQSDGKGLKNTGEDCTTL